MSINLFRQRLWENSTRPLGVRSRKSPSGSRLRCSLCIGLLLVSQVASATSPSYEDGDGHLAIRPAAETSWRMLQVADNVASPCQLKTSPAGVVRIALTDGVLFLGADSDAD